MGAQTPNFIKVFGTLLVVSLLIGCGALQNSLEVKTARDSAAIQCAENGTCIKDPRGLVVYNRDLITDNGVVKQEANLTLLTRLMNLVDEPKLLVMSDGFAPNFRGATVVGEFDPCDAARAMSGSNPTAGHLRELKQGRFKACISYIGDGLIKKTYSLDPIQVDTSAPMVSGAVVVENQTSSSALVTWSAAGDNLTLGGNLTYTIYKASRKMLTLDDARNFGTLVRGKFIDTTSHTLTALEPSQEYFVAIVVSDEAGNSSLVGSAAINTKEAIPPSVEAPTFSVPSGSYGPAKTVTLSSATSGSSIYYTADGSTPTIASTLYTDPIPVATSQTIKAFAVLTNWTNSAVSTASYTINGKVATPIFSVAAGAYGPSQSVTLSTPTDGATIYYTTDGSTPSTLSTVYSGTINVANSKTLKAFGIKANFSDSDVASISYTINGPVAAPVASVATGTFNNNQSVTLTTVPMAASIYYTVDGSTPTPSSTPYTGTIPISQTTTLKAIAVMANYIDSGIMSETYTVTAATPTADIPAGAYGPAQTVTLSSETTGAVVYYTTDGSTPTCSGATGSFDVLTTVTIKAIACKNNYNNSEVAIFPYTINGQVATPTMSVVTGTYNNDQSVILSTTTPGATIYYTTDGSTPTTASHVYSSAITISASQTIKAYAMKANYIDSGVGTEQYDMVVSRPIPSILPDYQYLTAQSLTFSSATIGAVIHYTTDGSTPTCDSATGTFEVTSWINIIAIACKDGYRVSDTLEFGFYVSTMTSRAVEAFPDTSGYPNITWRPAVDYSLSQWTNDEFSFYSDTIGTSMADFFFYGPGRHLAWLNQETSLGVTKNVYAKANGSSEYIPMGPYSTKLPPSVQPFEVIQFWNGVRATVTDSVSPGCNTGPRCIILGGAGSAHWAQATQYANIVKIKPDGSMDTLGGGLNGTVYSLSVDASGNIYAGGDFTCQSGSTSSGTYPSNTCAGSGGTTVLNNIAKWNGTSWSALGSGMNSKVNSLALDGSGNLYAGGQFATADGVTVNRIAKWNGTSWSTLGSGMNNYVYSIALDGLGNLYAGGYFSTAGGVSANRIAKWNGTSWSALGSGMNNLGNTVNSLSLDGSGNLYAGGNFTTAGGISANRIAKWNGISWSALGSGMNARVNSLAFDASGNLFAGGDFNCQGGSTSSGAYPSNTCAGSGGTTVLNYIAKWDGTSWSALGSGMDSPVNQLAFDGSGNLYAGGYFTSAGGGFLNYAAKWNGTSWSPLASSVDGPVVALSKDAYGSIYAGGSFKITGMLTTNYIAKWNGDTWSGFGSGMNNIVRALAVDSQTSGCTTNGNPCLYAGGDFTTAGGLNANYIAKWTGASWSSLGIGLNGQVSALVMDTSGNLYVGGNFTTADGLTVNHIAKWSGLSWSTLGSGMNGQVNSLAVDSAGNLFAGGAFTTAGGIAANYIAKWNGSSWTNLGTGMSGPGSVGVNALSTDSSGNLYAGGVFTAAGDVAASNVAKWNGTAWSSLGGGLSALSGDSSVSSLALDSSGNLYAGGSFTAASLTQVSTTTTSGSKMITLSSVAGLEIGMSCFGSNLQSYPVEITEINTVTNAVTFRLDAITTGTTTLSCYWPSNYITKWNGSSWQKFNSYAGNPQDPGGQISTLLIDNSGHLYAGGNFTTTGQHEISGSTNIRPFLAKWLPLFGLWF